MYNEKLEALIEAALTDGVLTAKEKQVLYKKAQTLGVDLDEFEMVLNSRLAKVEKEEQKQANANAPKTSYRGERRTCPNCKALVGELDMRCPYCGYELTGAENSTYEKLNNRIDKIHEDFRRQQEIVLKESSYTLKDSDENVSNNAKHGLVKSENVAIANAIIATAIPNAKADLFEFATAMYANMVNPNIYKEVGSAYFSKYNEAILKIKLLFKNDPSFVEILAMESKAIEQYKKARKKQKKVGIKPSAKRALIIGTIFVSVYVILFLVLSLMGV